MNYYKAMGMYMSGMEFTTSIMQVAIVAFGGLLIMRGDMNYIDLITFTLYVSTFISPVKRLVQFSETYMQGAAGFERFLEVMRTEPTVKDKPDAKVLDSVRGEIEYKDVCFDYGNGVPVLENVSFRIEPGQSLAVVGPSGGGKTTLCQLLPRFYDVSSGSVTVDGTDVRDVTQASLRKNIGMIQQDVFMFAGTIRENIRYGRAGRDGRGNRRRGGESRDTQRNHGDARRLRYLYRRARSDALRWAEAAHIHRPRFLKNPKILILDEATSALDTVTEQRIQNAFDKLSEGRTTIIIAHRLSTVCNADRIAVIEDEHIIEMGSHDELMAKNGAYVGTVQSTVLG